MTTPLYYNINNDLRPAPDYAKVFADAYQQSQQMGLQAQQIQSQQGVNKALAAGDYAGAQHTALAAGNTSALNEISGVQNNQIAQAQARLDRIASAAYSLKQLPPEQRPQAFQSIKPMLKSLGLDDNALANVNLSDAGLEQYIGQALDLKTKVEMNKGVVVGDDSRLVNPYNSNVMVPSNPKLSFQTVTAQDGSAMPYAVDPRTNQAVQLGGGVPAGGQAPAASSAAPTVAPAASSPAPAGGDAGFQSAIATVLQNEGSKLVAHDGNGAPVRFGINQGANPNVDVANLTREQAIQLYKDRYWDKSKAPTLPANMQTPYFDVYVRNPKVADRALAQSNGDPAQFMQLASGYFNRLAQSPKFAQYQQAWSNRDANNLRIATGGAPKTPETPQTAPSSGPMSPADYLAQHRTSAPEIHGQLPSDAAYYIDPKTNKIVMLEKGTPAGDAVPLHGDALKAQTEMAILDPKSLTVSGMGAAKAKIQIANSLPAILAPYNLTAQDVPTLQHLYAADQKAYTARNNQLSFLQASYGAAQQHAEEVRQLALQLRHMNGIKAWNQGAISYLEQTNDPTWTRLKRAADQYSGEIAKVITGNPQSGAGPVTDAARNEFQTITSGLSPDAIVSKLAQDDQMMKEKVGGAAGAKNALQQRMHGGISGYAALLRGGNAPAQPQQSGPRTIVRSGIQKSTGKRVVQYSDGSIEVQ